MKKSKTVLVETDMGLEPFTADAVKLDYNDIPHNLVKGTEYVVLNALQGSDFQRGNVKLMSEDEARHLGAFSLLFVNPPSNVQSQTV